MRLPGTAHTSRPWRIHELTPDFRLEDVWALPTPGGPNDFPLLVQGLAAGDLDPSRSSSRAARSLFALRWKVGALLRWDATDAGPTSQQPTLRDRLPADLRGARSGPELGPLRPLYLLDGEFAAEIANQTVHGVLHFGWVRNESGGHRGQMAILVKPNGRLGTGYMAAITPFRHRIVYPAMLRQIERGWQERAHSQTPAPT